KRHDRLGSEERPAEISGIGAEIIEVTRRDGDREWRETLDIHALLDLPSRPRFQQEVHRDRPKACPGHLRRQLTLGILRDHDGHQGHLGPAAIHFEDELVEARTTRLDICRHQYGSEWAWATHARLRRTASPI